LGFCTKCGAEIAEGARFCPKCGAQAPGAQAVPPPAAPQDPYLGRVLDGKFKIESLLGVGGMGKVYKATQLSLDKTVCVKVLRTNMMQDETLVGRFNREARAATRLNHPNSITLIDFGQAADDGSLYMVMEFIAGKDLSKVIQEERPLSEERIVNIMDQVLSALADAHAAGVIHRDLKPENIMVTDLRGTKDFVKVLDFGIAKVNEPTAEDAGLTQVGMVCGTPEYMSPEQARGEELDARSDVYAAAVIVYQMVVGRIPFEAPTAMGIVTKHLTETPTPPSKIEGAVISPALESVILKGMSKDKNGRQPTALALQQELNTVLNQKKGMAQEAPLGDSLFDDASTPPPATPSSAAPAETIARPAEKPGSSKTMLIVLVLLVVLGGGGAAAFFLLQGDKKTTPAEDTKTVAVDSPPKDKTDKPGESKDQISDIAKMHYASGKEFMTQMNYQKAIGLFKKAIKSSPNYAQAYKAMGMCYMNLGKMKKAKANLQNYLKMTPDAEDREGIEELISGL
jgi:serine/threonine protein kinase